MTALSPVDVNGFYKVTGSQEITFFVTSQWPNIPVSSGWTGDGFTGILGQIQIKSATNIRGVEGHEAYNWTFTLQTDTDQNIEGVTNVVGAILYPPGILQYTTKKVSGPIYGYYTVAKSVITFIFTTPPPTQTGEGWIISGLPTITQPLKIVSYTKDLTETFFTEENQRSQRVNAPTVVNQNLAILSPIDNSLIPDNPDEVKVTGFPGMIQEPSFTNTFIPGKFTNYTDAQVVALSGVKTTVLQVTGDSPAIRELNTFVEILPLEPRNYTEVKDRGFSSGSVISLFAKGPQEKYLLTEDLTKSQWNPEFKQYSNFVMYQRVIPFPPPSPVYQGQVVTLEIRPQELGHLLSNMYLSVTLPGLPSGYNYTDHIGRALIKQVDLLINETLVETIYDDWYIIHDQVFLDADEQQGIYQTIGQANAQSSQQQNVIIPLELFFCRRHSHNNKGRERLRRPYFPLCAMRNQRMYVRFTFNPSTWWCNVPVGTPTDIYPSGTTLWPSLIIEEIILDNAEKMYYQNNPLKYVINKVQRESVLSFQSGSTALQLTANFPVQTLAWFFRKQSYESTADGRYYNFRYKYGYTTQFIKTGVELTFPSGVSNYVDVISTAKITLNNIDILSTFKGSLYYTFKQPLEHSLSIPSKNIYTYSFGLNPKEYNQGGYLNFSKLNSQTTYLSLEFLTFYKPEIISGYNLYLFYSGYTELQFKGGFASITFN